MLKIGIISYPDKWDIVRLLCIFSAKSTKILQNHAMYQYFVYICTGQCMIMNFLKRTYIWIRRFRHRRGYGVHSPFAFGLITDVVYERHPYYAYRDLKQVRRRLPKGTCVYTQRVDKLLFRLANHVAPQRVLEVGTGAGLSLCYLSAGSLKTPCVSLTGENAMDVSDDVIGQCRNATFVTGPLLPAFRRELAIEPGVDFLHIAHTQDYAQIFEEYLPYAGEKSVVIIEGIYDTKAKREWWKQVVADKRTGVTFDLYELGLVFFDHHKNKQHYVVNF